MTDDNLLSVVEFHRWLSQCIEDARDKLKLSDAEIELALSLKAAEVHHKRIFEEKPGG